MVIKYIKRWSTSLIIREMQIKTTMRYNLTPVRMAIINKQQVLERMWRKGNPHASVVDAMHASELQTGVATVEKTMGVPQISNAELPHDSAIPLLGIYLKKSKTLIYKVYAPLCSLQHYLQ